MPEEVPSIPAEEPSVQEQQSETGPNPYSNGQTAVPSIPVRDLYPEGNYPVGLFIPYGSDWDCDNLAKNSAEEAAFDEYLNNQLHCDPKKLQAMRASGEIYREVQQYTRRLLSQPGAELYSVSVEAERCGRMLCGQKSPFRDQMRSGQAFPLGLSLNDRAAHWTPISAAEAHVVTDQDIIKVDTGYHTDGWLVDGSFTFTTNPDYKPILDATIESCRAAIKAAGPDVLLEDLGGIINEIISSYEYMGRPMHPIVNLSGHQVDNYRIHAGKSIPMSRRGSTRGLRMIEGEIYACETFASTGQGVIHDDYSVPVSHYMLDPKAVHLDLSKKFRDLDTRQLYQRLRKTFATLAWSPRWLDESPNVFGTPEEYRGRLKQMEKSGVLDPYPCLTDTRGCLTSQHEHTFYLGRTGKEIFTCID